MKPIVAALAFAAALSAQNFSDLKPSPQQVAWQDLEIGVLIHFGPNSFMDREWGDGTADPSVFNPAQLDAAQWVAAAESAGARYLVLVAKHHDGFCLWPTEETKYNVKASPWRGGHGDLVREVSEAARRAGLRFGVYLSPWDRHDPRYRDAAKYDEYYRNELTELATRYGDLTEFWLDGAGSEGHVYDFMRYIRTLRTYQPNAMIFADVGLLPYADIRWVGNEDGTAKEENWNVVDAYQILRWRPAEADTPLREAHWFWHPNDEKSLKSVEKLVETYHETIGRGAQLMIGLAPDNRGLLPEVDVKRLAEFGAEVKRIYGKGLLENTAISTSGHPDSSIGPEYSCQYRVSLRGPITLDRAVTMEDLTDGQRIRRYAILGRVGNEMRTLATGTTVGHKKIDLFAPVTVDMLVFEVRSALGVPRLRSFNVYLGAK